MPVPPHWYQYEFPLPVVPGAPVPSTADYSQTNVAPLIEFFANILSKDRSELVFRYENNTPNNTADDIFVAHPDDSNYLPAYIAAHSVKSPELIHYEKFAKKSKILKLFQDNSPANITYFQN